MSAATPASKGKRGRGHRSRGKEAEVSAGRTREGDGYDAIGYRCVVDSEFVLRFVDDKVVVFGVEALDSNTRLPKM